MNNKVSRLLIMNSFIANLIFSIILGIFMGYMSENALFGIIVFVISTILLDFSRRYSYNKKRWSILKKKADRKLIGLLFFYNICLLITLNIGSACFVWLQNK